MRRRGLRVAGQRGLRGGDALPGNIRAPGFVRGKIREVKTRPRELPAVGRVICVGLKQRLRPVEFLFGPRSENFMGLS